MSGTSERSVLDCFAVGTVSRLESLAGAGGFSGSQLWKVTAESGQYALRRWPEETSAERLAFIHAFQRHLRGAGLRFIPALVGQRGGETFVEQEGRLWELATWMSGKADYREHPATERLGAAVRALARIHQAAPTMPGQSRVGTSPGLNARLDQLRKLRSGGIERIKAAVARRPLVWDDLARRICQQFDRLAADDEYGLEHGASFGTILFPCLRDIWHDHVLFTGDEVTGIIDFGAARVESPAGDIARLVGSLVGDNREGWDSALGSYEQVRPLDAKQRQLIGIFDSSGVLLSGVNWLTWLYLAERQFEGAAGVTRRLHEIATRLERVATPRPRD